MEKLWEGKAGGDENPWIIFLFNQLFPRFSRLETHPELLTFNVKVEILGII
jgi:hypothetical protein